MDEDLVAFCIFFVLLVGFPLAVVLTTFSCIAYARTKKWDKERSQRVNALESEANTLLDSDDDFLDTDDENEYNERKAEEEQDRLLTFGQMWRKEFRKVWNGKGVQQLAKEREREERRKLAKAVATELDRRERRRARRAAKEAEERETLPPYYKQ